MMKIISQKNCLKVTVFLVANEDVKNDRDKQHKLILHEGKPPQKQIKRVIFEDAILKAFGSCRQCGSKCILSLTNQVGSSCYIAISCIVDNRHDFIWSTGPTLNRLPVFHLLLASGILCTG